MGVPLKGSMGVPLKGSIRFPVKGSISLKLGHRSTRTPNYPLIEPWPFIVSI